MRKRFFKNLRQVVTVLGLIFGMTVLLIMGLYARDYDLKFEDGKLQYVAEIPIPKPTSLTLVNNDPGKITMKTGRLSSVDGYQFRVSGNSAMFLSKSYRTQLNSRIEANLRKGKTIYVQVRAYKENDSGRVVYGKWGTKKSVEVK